MYNNYISNNQVSQPNLYFETFASFEIRQKVVRQNEQTANDVDDCL